MSAFGVDMGVVSKSDHRTDALMGGAAAAAGGSLAATRSGTKDVVRSVRPGKELARRKLPTPLRTKGFRKMGVGTALAAGGLGLAVAGERREKKLSKSVFGVDLGAEVSKGEAAEGSLLLAHAAGRGTRKAAKVVKRNAPAVAAGAAGGAVAAGHHRKQSSYY